jgi:ribosomal 50S subunit-recycling heat shock protein
MPYIDNGVIPEIFGLEMNIEGHPVGAFVSKEVSDSVNVGDIVTVRYTQRRFTQKIQVIGVEPLSVQASPQTLQ